MMVLIGFGVGLLLLSPLACKAKCGGSWLRWLGYAAGVLLVVPGLIEGWSWLKGLLHL